MREDVENLALACRRNYFKRSSSPVTLIALHDLVHYSLPFICLVPFCQFIRQLKESFIGAPISSSSFAFILEYLFLEFFCLLILSSGSFIISLTIYTLFLNLSLILPLFHPFLHLHFVTVVGVLLSSRQASSLGRSFSFSQANRQASSLERTFTQSNNAVMPNDSTSGSIPITNGGNNNTTHGKSQRRHTTTTTETDDNDMAHVHDPSSVLPSGYPLQHNYAYQYPVPPPTAPRGPRSRRSPTYPNGYVPFQPMPHTPPPVPMPVTSPVYVSQNGHSQENILHRSRPSPTYPEGYVPSLERTFTQAKNAAMPNDSTSGNVTFAIASGSPRKNDDIKKMNKKEVERLQIEAEKEKRKLLARKQREQARAVMQKRMQMIKTSGNDIDWLGGLGGNKFTSS
ncbi:hypothetical protein JOM56_005682 [Amanita muscaria]